MKKTILFIALLLFSIASIAQNFECQELTSKLSRWNKTKSGNNKSWAKVAFKQFPLNKDGDIYYKYTVLNPSKKTIKEMMEMSKGFLKSNLNQDKGAEVKIDTVTNICYGEGKWANVGEVIGFYNSTIINAEIKIRIKVFADSLTFETKVPHYILGSFNLMKGTDSDLVSPGDVFPLKQDSDHKESYAQAFINCNAYSYNTMNNFLAYLNKHKDEKESDVW